MRLDHVAYRVKDRHKTANFFIECFGYRLAEGEELENGGFQIHFPDGSTAECLVLEPPEKLGEANMPWTYGGDMYHEQTYHLPPEIFISDGSDGSIVGDWVKARNGVGGIHHLAFQCESVESKMQEWREKGYAEFTSEKPLQCPGLVQAFTKPSDITGVIYELIERSTQGFCKTNVRGLMESTKGL